MNTIPFGQKPRETDPLLARAAELPKDVEPSRDLWPGIAGRLDAQPPARRAFGWPAALAAGMLVAAVSALLTWGLVRDPESGTAVPQQAAAQPAIVPVRYGPNTPLGEKQLAARDQLLVSLRERLDQLPPATRDSVVKNLAIIQRAADEIDAALAQDPANGLLTDLVLNTYRKELQLYTQVVTAGDAGTRST